MVWLKWLCVACDLQRGRRVRLASTVREGLRGDRESGRAWERAERAGRSVCEYVRGGIGLDGVAWEGPFGALQVWF